MKNKTVFIFIFLATYFTLNSSHAFNMPKSIQLPEQIEKSEIIFIAETKSFLPIKNSVELKPSGFLTTKDGRKIPVYGGPKALFMATTVISAGTYLLDDLQDIKGQSPAHLELSLPAISSLSYGDNFDLDNNQKLVFFMKKIDGKLVPTDSLRPYIPLNNYDDSFNKIQPINNQIIDILSNNLQFKKSRKMIAYLLKDFHSSQVVLALAPYNNDDDLQTRDYVLSGLARNQQISAIDKIRDLNRLQNKQRRGAQSIIDLESFSGVKAAVPYLNPLLFEAEQYIRLNAVSALGRTADSSSIPYFLLTLRDPEPQKVNAESAFGLLQRLTKNASSVSYNDFRAQKPKAIAEMIKWWQDELSGKHPLAEDETPRVTLREGDRYEAKDLPRLNEGLFMRSEFTRGAAIKALDKLADQSSIPYLLLAQYDPKPDIAFGAYKTLHRLIPELGAAKLRGSFDVQRETLTQQGFDWWVKYLQDNLPAEMKQKAPVPAAIAGK